MYVAVPAVSSPADEGLSEVHAAALAALEAALPYLAQAFPRDTLVDDRALLGQPPRRRAVVAAVDLVLVTGAAGQIGGEPGRLLADAASSGFAEGMSIAFVIGAAALLVGAGIVARFLPARSHDHEDEAPVEVADRAGAGYADPPSDDATPVGVTPAGGVGDGRHPRLVQAEVVDRLEVPAGRRRHLGVLGGEGVHVADRVVAAGDAPGLAHPRRQRPRGVAGDRAADQHALVQSTALKRAGKPEDVAAADPRVVVVDNPTGRTPDGLNAALAVTSHEIVVRMDGHGVLSDGYLRRAVEVLEETGAANVGGLMLAEGTDDMQQAVAVAMRSPLGMGGARFHVGGRAGPAETVYLGVFRRSWLRRVGGYGVEQRRRRSAFGQSADDRIHHSGGHQTGVGHQERPTDAQLAEDGRKSPRDAVLADNPRRGLEGESGGMARWHRRLALQVPHLVRVRPSGQPHRRRPPSRPRRARRPTCFSGPARACG